MITVKNLGIGMSHERQVWQLDPSACSDISEAPHDP